MIDVRYENHMGDDLTVVNAARVSFGKRSKLVCTDSKIGTYEMKKGDVKLVNYLGSHNHISPFGHCFASFSVKAPIFVARQLVKHKFLRWNEISRRYVDDKPEFYFPPCWKGRPVNVKQGRDEECTIDTAYYDRDDGYNSWDGDAVSIAAESYQKMIELGIAPEQARMILPQNTMTEWWWSGSLDAFADMCNLRCKPDAQYETRLVADLIDERMSELFPVAWATLRDADTDN